MNIFFFDFIFHSIETYLSYRNFAIHLTVIRLLLQKRVLNYFALSLVVLVLGWKFFFHQYPHTGSYDRINQYSKLLRRVSSNYIYLSHYQYLALKSQHLRYSNHCCFTFFWLNQDPECRWVSYASAKRPILAHRLQ